MASKHVGRRSFLKSSITGLSGATLLAAENGGGASSRRGESAVFREPQRDVPVVDTTDVVVRGAGPAGVAAAIAAARVGASTRLIETRGCLGGTWTASLLSWILDSDNKRGLMQEILERLQNRNASAKYGRSVGYDVEQMKLLLEQMCLEAGVEVRLHTRVASAACDESGRLKLAVTESKSGREAFGGGVFIDATGDGDLAARAGCQFDYGGGQSGAAQPMSMIALLTGIDPEGTAEFVRGLAEPRGERDPKGRLLAEMERAGVTPSYARPTLFYIRKGLFCLMANHEYGVSATDAAEISEATIRARAEVHQLVDALRGLGGVWKDVQIVATPEHIGVREGRRVRGLYQVTENDLAQGARHPDAVCRVTFPVDVHSPNPQKSKGIAKNRIKAKPYDIPYRALIARDVGGLLTAGRCISGDFIAHSSYRVTGNAVAMGEAAGVAAAIAAATHRLPQDVPWPEIHEAIEETKQVSRSGSA